MLQQLASSVPSVSKDISIRVTGLSKTYRILRREEQSTSAAEAVIKRVREKRRGPGRSSSSTPSTT